MTPGERCPRCGYVAPHPDPDLLQEAALLCQNLAHEQYRATEIWLTERRFCASTERAERLTRTATRAIQRFERRQRTAILEDLKRD